MQPVESKITLKGQVFIPATVRRQLDLSQVHVFSGYKKEEREFWETHGSSEYLDLTKAKRVVMPNLKPSIKTISLRLSEGLLDSIKVEANKRDMP